MNKLTATRADAAEWTDRHENENEICALSASNPTPRGSRAPPNWLQTVSKRVLSDAEAMASIPEPLVLADQKAGEARELIAKGSYDPAIELLATALELRCLPSLMPVPAHSPQVSSELTRTPSALQYRGARRRARRLC